MAQFGYYGLDFKALALQQVGFGYKFFVSALKQSTRDERTFIDATVIAYRDQEIRYITVHWDEKE